MENTKRCEAVAVAGAQHVFAAVAVRDIIQFSEPPVTFDPVAPPERPHDIQMPFYSRVLYKQGFC